MLPTKQGKYRFDDFEVDLGLRSLHKGGHPITVGPRTFDLLSFFLQNAQRIVTENELTGALWSNLQPEESNLAQHIFLLRQALTSQQSGDKTLLTIPRQGYCFTLPVAKIESDPDSIAASVQLPTVDFGVQARPRPKPKSVDTQAHMEALNNESEKPISFGKDRSQEEDERQIIEPAEPSTLVTEPTRDDPFDYEGDGSSKGALHRRTPIVGSWTGNKKVWAAISGVAMLIVLTGGTWLGWRSTHPRVQVPLSLLVAGFENSTGDPQLDGSLQTALTIALQQSPLLVITSPGRVMQASASATGQSPANPAIGRDLCRRLQDQAYVTSSIHPFSVKYLISMEIHACSDGAILASSKGLASTLDAAVPLLTRMAGDLRTQLGESSKSIAEFSKPLFTAGAGSLPALKAYSDATRLASQDELKDAVTLYQLAVRLEPNFAIAYADLGAAYLNLGEPDEAIQNITKAFELRDNATEPTRLYINSIFTRDVTGDLWAAIRNAMQWNQEYPNNPAPLGALAQLSMEVGKPALAVDPAKRALELNPGDAANYVLLATAQMHLGQSDEAASTCRLAVARHLDHAPIHAILLQLASLRLDQPGIDQELAWAKGKPEESLLQIEKSKMDFASGRVKSALAILNGLAADLQVKKDVDGTGQIFDSVPRTEAELGYPESALSLLTKLPAAVGLSNLAVAWAEIGETSRAETILERETSAHRSNTLWRQVQGPEIKAAIDLVEHHPDDAVEALEPASRYDLRAFDIPALRGRAYLANKQPELAEAEFHKILDHPGIDPLSYNYPLAELGLARALAQQQKPVEAGFAYKIVLQIWKDADADFPRLKEAKAEYAKLNSASAQRPAKSALD